MRNLTEISLKNKSLIWYFIIVTAIGGIFFYSRLGRMEDPNFTINEMIVSAAWPGMIRKSALSGQNCRVPIRAVPTLPDTRWMACR